eukprot:CAMPEP_0172811088 /NCGR_PEP_ID=MMETSP1075-20121228/9201_1 /TAXON_ID=2916 /ORGANISM="Ceratium fusus, Strain PA161109" /LENGTH=108 /DNA_ID=CAMNT_0013650477 /DNA_START=161 /DNA_END=483 /DNA_ORIENTATION=+
MSPGHLICDKLFKIVTESISVESPVLSPASSFTIAASRSSSSVISSVAASVSPNGLLAITRCSAKLVDGRRSAQAMRSIPAEVRPRMLRQSNDAKFACLAHGERAGAR